MNAAVQTDEHGGALVPLDNLAAEINGRFRKATEIEAKATDHRIAAGLLLVDARTRVDGGETGLTWEKWCASKIDRSQGDIRKVMRIAGNKDPAQAREDEKERTRQHVAEHRERAYVSAVSQPEPVSPAESLAFVGWWYREISPQFSRISAPHHPTVSVVSNVAAPLVLNPKPAGPVLDKAGATTPKCTGSDRQALIAAHGWGAQP